MSDPKRIGEVLRHIRQIKAGNYPAVVGRDGQYRIEERPFQELGEPAKLAILQGAVNWSGVSNRDRGHILLSEIDPGKITEAQRTQLIDLAMGTFQELVDRHAQRADPPRQGPRIAW